ncbi:hypothetical protein HNQ56_002309 [Anaerotaenia torta]|uniref:hypothetical protein n=1 Tax=Anaerotaenia torta TaxID=433293 RepID=UPI003D19CDA1
MKKYFGLFFLLIITLSACAAENSQEKEKVKSEIQSLFEEADNRSFDLSFPIEVEGEECYKVVVSGKLKSNRTYDMDTFAIHPDGEKQYFLNKETGAYERFYTTPTFACKTSPDGELRMESVGMYLDGPGGLHSLREMRIIDASTGGVLWSGSSFLMNDFQWSEDSRFVAAGYAGRQWVQTDMIDTKDYSVVPIPDMDDILKAVPGTSKPSDNVPLPTFKAVGWLSPSVICIQFQWATDIDTEVSGQYEYDVINKKMEIKEIKEESFG